MQYLVNQQVAVTWKLDPSSNTVVASDFEVEIVTPSGVTFTEDNLSSFTAPTPSASGEAVLNFTPVEPGRHVLRLVSGVAGIYAQFDRMYIYAINEDRTILNFGDGSSSLINTHQVRLHFPYVPGPNSLNLSDFSIHAYDFYSEANQGVVVVGRHLTTSAFRILYSADGFNWNLASTPAVTDSGLYVGYYNGRWLCVSSNKVVYESINSGATWTAIGNLPVIGSLSLSGNLDYSIYAGGWWLVSGNNIYFSSDNGVNWSHTTQGGTAHAFAVETPHNRVIRYDDNGGAYYLDTDGNWWGVTNEPIATTRAGNFKDGVFIFGNNSGFITYSSGYTGGPWATYDTDPTRTGAIEELIYDSYFDKWMYYNSIQQVWREAPDYVSGTTWSDITEGPLFDRRIINPVRARSSDWGWGVLYSNEIILQIN
jgi:hypothetical protein